MSSTEESALPEMRVALPAARSAALVETLAATECPALTARRARRAERAGAAHDPIVWARARGSSVWDADGNRYVDLSAGFGAAAIGHGHPRLREALGVQADRLVHALGDVHPSDVKVQLLERLAALLPLPDARVMLGLSGSDAVTAALKTATLATGRPGVLAFEGGYHGLGYGPLAACGYSAAFRAPFAAQLNPAVAFAPYPARGAVGVDAAVAAVAKAWDAAAAPIGAVLVEPMLGRGGVVVPPDGFIAALVELAHARGALVIADEVMTGLGRTGAMLACGDAAASVDLVCLGKALGGGVPVSACIGRGDAMAAWGDPAGEALHTSTFAGYPLGAAAALATLDVVEGEGLCERARALGRELVGALQALGARHDCIREIRGRGLLVGVELDGGARCLAVLRRLLERGYIAVPAASDARVLSLTPPLTIARAQLDAFVKTLDAVLSGDETLDAARSEDETLDAARSEKT